MRLTALETGTSPGLRAYTVMKLKQEIERELEEIERQIRETEKRLPAHSVKPPIMIELFKLEDQRDALLAQLEKLKTD